VPAGPGRQRGSGAAQCGESSQLLKILKLLGKSRLTPNDGRIGRKSRWHFGNRATPTGNRGRGSHGAWNADREPNHGPCSFNGIKCGGECWSFDSRAPSSNN
jgi:hypothetical protein